MRKNAYIKAFVAIAVAFMTVGCVEELTTELHEPGSEIVFGVNTSWPNGVTTRTEYSGKDEDDNPISKEYSEYERIDWLVSHDKIRVLCDAATGKSTPTKKTADYVIFEIKDNTGEKQKSKAGITSCDDNSLQWGTGTHYFYALYPAAGTTSNYEFTDYKTATEAKSTIESVSSNKAKISGVIPADQEAVKSSNIYKPNMNYAYMYAATKVDPSTVGDVLLSFNPLITAIEFTISSISTDPISTNLTKVELSSSSTPLTGNFSATIDVTGSSTSVSYSTPAFSAGTNDKISITLPTESGQTTPGILLSSTPVKFTFLTLPVEQTDLTLTLYFGADYSTKRTLKLKTSDGAISVGACKKAYISLGVPGTIIDEYVLGTLSDVTVTYAGAASSATSLGTTFTSYRNINTAKTPVKFKFEYSEANADGTCKGVWTYTPDWLTMDTGIDYDGSVSGQNFGVGVDAQINSMIPLYEHDAHTKALYEAPPKSNFDLSTINVATGATVSTTTANCYVVQASGTYRFPVVYGNSVNGGSATNTKPRYAWGHGWGEEGKGEKEFLRDSEGNLILDGEGHSQQIVTDGFYLGRFKNHLNAGIGAAYIGYLFSDRTLTAALMWTDVEGLVTNVSYHVASDRRSDYISFEVPKATICQGNALIAVLVNGVVAWSWHIWVTDQDLTHPVTGPASTYEGDNHKAYKFAPVNLGWCDPKITEQYAERKCYVRAVQVDDTGTPLTDGKASAPALITQQPRTVRFGGNNPYYQWGRKDPMQASNGNGNSPKTYYGDHKPTSEVRTTESTIGYAIQHPNVFIYDSDELDSSNPNWCSGGFTFEVEGESHYYEKVFYYNLWNSDATTHGFTNAETVYQEVYKTIYDPSPVGYKVPQSSAYSGFTASSTPWGTFNGDNGRIYNSTLFFPAVGTEGHRDGSSNLVGGMWSHARYWTASPDGRANAYRGLSFRFAQDEFYSENNNLRPTGAPVRPILDDINY